MPEISVIVPVYNVEGFLENCIQSVLAQSRTDWELLLVNDGSSDASPEICRAWEKKDSRIRLLDRENGGVSSARNAGLAAARGEYIFFLDSDDTIPPEALETLLAAARRRSAQITVGGALCVDETGETVQHIVFPERFFSASGEALLFFLKDMQGLYSCWGKLFSREFIGDTRFRSFARGEDALFCAELLCRCTACAVTDPVVYRYLLRGGSATKQGFNAHSVDLPLAWEKIYELTEKALPECAAEAARITLWQTDRIFASGMETGSAAWRASRRDLARLHRRFAAFQPDSDRGRKEIGKLVYALSPELYYRLGRH